MTRRIVALALILAGLLASCSGNDQQNAVHVIKADGDIDVAMERYIDRALDDAESTHAKAAVIELDTPGGYSTSMRKIVQRIEAADVPVIVYVSPIGARAASAGTFITMSAHIAVMAPNTSIGAASAINSDGSDIEGTLGRKVENDAVAFIRGIAELRGRNADWAEDAVRNAVAVDQSEAVKLNVVNFEAKDLDDLLQQADGMTIDLHPGEPLTLSGLTTAPRVNVSMNLWEQLIAIIANPTIASLLITFGFLGILIELFAPGFGVPGIAGTVAIILGFLGLQVLPVDTVGLILMALGLGLIASELFVSGGFLGAAGVLVVALGSIIAFRDTPSELRPPTWLIVALAAALATAFLFVATLYARLRRREAQSEIRTVIGKTGTAKTRLGPLGEVVVEGYGWPAQLLGADHADPGERLRVVSADHNIIHVRKLDSPETGR
ncbi:MAG: nodulation protein NfeD [Dehalococcoidia bacterium]